MTQNNHSRLDAFVSLAWYDTLLRFITNFIAKTSELLLAAGLVVSSANFLTDGAILGTTTAAAQAWAWAQALAIDSSLAISFYHVLFCFKQRDWIKCVLYCVLTGLLAVVAGTLTNIDIFSHAIHAPINNAIAIMGLNVKTLSSVRSIAVVGFVLMSRLRDVSLKDLGAPEPAAPERSLQTNQQAPQTEQTSGAGSPHFTIEEMALLLQVLARPNEAIRTHITMEPDPPQTHRPSPGGAPPRQLDLTPTQRGVTQRASVDPLQSQTDSLAPDPSHLEHSCEPDPSPDLQRQHATEPVLHSAEPDPAQKGREERLEQAYQELVAEGQKISGRTLAGRAHIHRALCTEWLQTRQHTQSARETKTPASEERSSEHSEHREPDSESGEQKDQEEQSA